MPPDAARNYDLIALDLDGTLLGPDGRVSPANLAAIERARAEGCRVAVCTGRGLIECAPILTGIAQRDPVVVAGGALTVAPAEAPAPAPEPVPPDWASPRTVRRVTMPAELLAPSIEIIHEAGHAALVLKDRATAGFDYLVLTSERDHEPDPISLWWFEQTGGLVRYARSLGDDDHPELSIRVGVCCTPGEVGSISRQLRARFEDRVVLHSFASDTWHEKAGVGVKGRAVALLEVFDGQAGKWPAARTLAESYGIAPERVAAVGDEDNDLDMVTHAGLGVAMGNAVDTIKDAADRVTRPNHEDGVAHAIDMILEGRW